MEQPSTETTSITAQTKQIINYGDLIILWGEANYIVTPLTVTKGSVEHNAQGAFYHDELVGKIVGTKVYSRNNKGFLHALWPTPELWTRALKFRTQILYFADISLISLYLELKPGSIVLEAGTGSGSLSTSMARCIQPNGRLYTFEFNKDRVEAAKVDFKTNKMDHIITVTWRDIYKDGFQVKGKANAVFLDLPSPWLAIDSANEALVPNGKICTFSPCIEQVQKNCTALRQANFLDLHTVECLLRPYQIINRSLKPLPDRETHTKRKGTEDSSNDPKKRARESTQTLAATEEKPSDKQEEPMVTDNDTPAVPRSASVAYINPLTDIKGHTGFLTFARKPIN